MTLSRNFLMMLLAVAGLASACSSATEHGGEAGSTGKPGDFVSADAYAGQTIADGTADGGLGSAGSGSSPPLGNPGVPADPREVVEGDIYRVLDQGALLNLNSYRGLQVIDISNPAEPAIIGRYGVLGSPVEMYTRGTTAFVLLNDWHGYYGTREDVAITRKQGGLLVMIDLSDRSKPREIGRALIAGSILTSRVVQNDSVAALYVASTDYAQYDQYGSAISKTIVTSFDIAGAQLVKKSELDLGGYVKTVQATPSELIVASEHYDQVGTNSTVAVIDISDPSGAMKAGDTVQIPGSVNNQFNLDLYNGILRVVSTSWTTSDNQVQTFDASDLSDITPLHTCTFGQGQQLYATLFLGNKAFFVTYFRQDPFHAFAIGDDGTCVEKNEFIVSGWNDYFRSVSGGTRLIGVGSDDVQSSNGTSRPPAVSLYDITDLSNTSPLLARATASDLQWSWSEAMTDHRAFSVIEGAVSVTAADGTEETGLVLLPFSGSTTENGQYRYISGVTLFTFSDRTVTERARLDHDSAVRRTFLTGEETIANLSEVSLSLYDHSDPTAPELLGTLELAPDYARVLRFGDYVARAKRPSYEAYYENALGQARYMDTIDIVPAGADLNSAEPVASFEVPGDARLLKSGELLVSIVQSYVDDEVYETEVKVYDLSDPTRPRAAGTAKTRDLTPTYFGSYGGDYGWGRGGSFVGCGVGLSWFDGSQADGVFALGDRVVFVDARGEEERLGLERMCERSIPYDETCNQVDCPAHFEGYIQCRSLDGGAESCTEYLASCSWAEGLATCEPATRAEVEPLLRAESCWSNERYRYWSRYAFKALDVSDPDAPVFGELENMPRTEEGVSVLPDGDALYYTYQAPVTVQDDSRPHVAYRFKKLEFGDVNALDVGPSVSVPGELLAVNGARAYTKDLRWGGNVAETYLHEIALHGDHVTLESSRRFDKREVVKVVADGDRLYVTHKANYGGYYYSRPEDEIVKLALLDGGGLTLASEVDVDAWSTLEAVHGERALFTVPGGLLMVNVEDAGAPYAQAFFDSKGWPEQILFEQGEVLISAGRHGIYRFDATASNLLTE